MSFRNDFDDGTTLEMAFQSSKLSQQNQREKAWQISCAQQKRKQSSNLQLIDDPKHHYYKNLGINSGPCIFNGKE